MSTRCTCCPAPATAKTAYLRLVDGVPVGLEAYPICAGCVEAAKQGRPRVILALRAAWERTELS